MLPPNRWQYLHVHCHFFDSYIAVSVPKCFHTPRVSPSLSVQCQCLSWWSLLGALQQSCLDTSHYWAASSHHNTPSPSFAPCPQFSLFYQAQCTITTSLLLPTNRPEYFQTNASKRNFRKSPEATKSGQIFSRNCKVNYLGEQMQNIFNYQIFRSSFRFEITSFSTKMLHYSKLFSQFATTGEWNVILLNLDFSASIEISRTLSQCNLQTKVAL